MWTVNPITAAASKTFMLLVRPIRAAGSPPGLGLDQHRIAKGEKAVSALDCGAICGQNAFASGERADQYEQRGLRQMKVRYQRIDDAELETRLYENRRFIVAGANATILLCGTFERAHHGRACRDDSAAFRLRRGHILRSPRRYGKGLRVHAVFV